ncbi:MAG: tRNA pseudouridine(55) synthase TruB [Paenibacillaceae bacterium]
MMTLEGVLPVIKPVDFTSHDVVAKVRGILGIRRIGHTGTLDPKVTGVLPLCIGRATRVVEYIQDLPKQYEAVLTIGLATDTEDMTGNVIERVEQVDLSIQDIEKVFAKFLGVIDQVPPMYSAIKVDGQRLYDLARQGQVIERQPRKVEIYELEIRSADLELAHPQIKFRVKCSKGTYIRTLCVDIGQALGYPAVMSELVRTATGSILLADCLTLEELSELAKQGAVALRMIPTDVAITHLPSCHVSDLEALHAVQGKTIHPTSLPNETYLDQEVVRLYSTDERFLGIFRWHAEQKSFTPEKVFN